MIQNADGEHLRHRARRPSLKLALSLSCNIPFAELGDAARRSRPSHDQAEKFGFEQAALASRSPVEPSVYPTQHLDQAQLALRLFGQCDDRVTPMQMAMVSAAIGNGGVLMKPNLVEARSLAPDLDTVEHVRRPSSSRQPVTSARRTPRPIMQMMVDGVDHGAATQCKNRRGRRGR